MPNNCPAPTEIVASEPRLLWYWNQAAAEMDRRGNLCPIDAYILETFAMLADMRHRLKRVEPKFSNPYEFAQEWKIESERISDILNEMLLPPNFLDTIDQQFSAVNL